ncbi:MAG: transposase [Gammaproteobacteria bacterium]|nr:transposase [Gammaproteobacteria bacterium]
MARLPRYTIKNQPQHIIQRGLNGQDILIDDEDYEFYWECLLNSAQNNRLKIHAYVLMPDHVHLLASPATGQSIPKTLQSLGRKYVQYFNNKYASSGTLWEGRYRATILDSKEYLLICSRYIELNPVRAEMVKHPRDYDWCSYGYNAMGYEDPLITEHRLFSHLATREQQSYQVYRSLFKKRISSAELQTIRDATNKGWALGDNKFATKIGKKGGRRATQLPRGRPLLS